MDIFTVFITQIHSEKPGKRGVFVEADTDCYGVKHSESLYFKNRIWERVKAQGKYLETEAYDRSYGEYVERLDDDEYYRRFECDIKKFTDEEIVAEINRRAEQPGIFCKIGFEVKAIVKKR